MPADLQSILKLQVPVIVQIGQRTMPVADVMSLVPGAIIELPKTADEELDLLVNNQPIGSGAAVKVGENFGIRVSFMGDLAARVKALAGEIDTPAPGPKIAPEPAPVAKSETKPESKAESKPSG